MLGTIRTLSEKTQTMVFNQINTIASGVATSLGGRAEIKITKGYPVLSNAPEAYTYLSETFEQMDSPIKQVESIFPQLVGEDFAYFARTKPSCFFALGLIPEDADSYPQLHQADFDFNNDALPIGMRCFSELVLKFWD